MKVDVDMVLEASTEVLQSSECLPTLSLEVPPVEAASVKPPFKSSGLPLIHRYAEVWLAEAVELLRPRFTDAGHEIPPVHVSIGFSCTGYRFGSKSYTQAMCYARRMSVDNINEIYIAPVIRSAEQVLELLTHELIHAVLDCHHGHGPEFQRIATDVNLLGARYPKPKSFIKGLLLERKLLKQLGRYPRGGMHS